MDTVNGSHEKSIASKEGDDIPTHGSTNTQSMTRLKHRRNTEVARARVAELIDIHGSAALNLGVASPSRTDISSRFQRRTWLQKDRRNFSLPGYEVHSDFGR